MKGLKLKWAFGFDGDVTAFSQPTVIDDQVFVGSAGGVIHALRALSQLEVVSVEEISTCATRLRDASTAVDAASEGVIAAADKRVSVLKAALEFHDEAGDGDCPVCGVGQLDGAWAQSARSAISDDEAALAEYRSATTELKVVNPALYAETEIFFG